MASWSERLSALQAHAQNDPNWLDKKLQEHLTAISTHRKNTTVIFYASGFLQKAADNVLIRSCLKTLLWVGINGRPVVLHRPFFIGRDVLESSGVSSRKGRK